MGNGPSMTRPPRNPVPEGKKRICVAGFRASPFTGRARAVAALIAEQYPDQYESWFYFDTSDNFYAFLKETFDPVPFPPHLKGHASSPFVWLEHGKGNVITPIGGNDYLSKWVNEQPALAKDSKITNLVASWYGYTDLFHNADKKAPQSTADITTKA